MGKAGGSQYARGALAVEHIYSSTIRSSGCHRIFRLTHRADLGLGAVDEPGKTTNCGLDPVVGRFCFCHGICLTCSLLYSVCAGDSRLPVLQPGRYEDIPLGIFAFSWRDRVWARWCMATEFTTLARSRCCDRHAGVLVNGSGV